MMLELPVEVETEIEARARERGQSAVDYVCETLKQSWSGVGLRPVKTSFGLLAGHGIDLSFEDFVKNRRDMMASWEERYK